MKEITDVATIVFVYVVVSFLITFPMVWLWNSIIPDLFGLPTITFWQMFGLQFLFNGLFRTSTVSRKG